ncbi:MAG: PilZ domain-containing protein [Deltaproteobacteria bacterium]|nr:PilZ domain-containing protein [Deltaproteobacteria bacterium]
MQALEVLAVGLAFELVASSGETKQRFHVRVLEVSEDTFRIALPQYMGRPAALAVGTVLEGVFNTSGGICLFQTRVVEQLDKPVRYLLLSLPEQVRSIQRREHVRVEERLPFTFTIVTGTRTKVALAGETRDISGGGLRCNAETSPTVKLAVGVEGDVLLCLPDEMPIRCLAKVVRCQTIGPPGRLEFSIQFLNIPERERSRVIRHVFACQRDLRRRGLL